MEMDSLPKDGKVTATAVNPTPLPLANLPQLAKSLNLGHQFFRVSFKHYKKLIRSNHRAVETSTYRDHCTFLSRSGTLIEGQLFEALNVVALMDLLAIWVYENNHYGMGAVEWKAAKSPSYYKSGDYVPRLKVDGVDGCGAFKVGMSELSFSWNSALEGCGSGDTINLINLLTITVPNTVH
ncbi:hypothetical protein RJT34_13855 [Clitoria ternatea]|uniref:Dehydrogenase E1 component domain-containing protein n=1 Tax=Clitoria ternatea TaxID=43366 RepID=A0AAN9PM73_CLITE